MSSSAGEGSPEERLAADLAAETRRKAEDLAEQTAATAGSLAEATAAKALALASALSATLTEIARRLDKYSALGKRSSQIIATLRKIIFWMAVSFVLDITLTIVLGFTAFSAHDTASANAQLVQEVHMQQSALHAAQLQACAGGNTFRADQDTIWRDFIGLIAKPSPGETAAQVAKTNQLAAQFLGYVATVNHPVNCAKLYGQ